MSLAAAPTLRALPAQGPLLACLALTTLFAQLGATIANVGLPTLMTAFGVGLGAVQWVVLSYLLAVTALVVSVGRLGDLIGKKRLFLGGIAGFTLASAACAAAPGLGVLIAARAVQGAGGAVLMAFSFAFVGEAVPQARAGHAMGLLGTVSSLGTMLAPSLGGLLITALGWRWIFLINLPLGLVALWLAHRHLPDDRPRGAARTRFDGAGTAALVLLLLGYTLAMTEAQRAGFGDPLVIALLAGAAVALAAFLAIEARVASPLVRLSLFRDPLLSASLAAGLLVATIMMSTMIVGPFFLTRAVGLSTGSVGLILSIGPLIAALAGLPSGWIVDRIGARRTMVGGLVCLTLGLGAMSRVTIADGVIGYVLAITAISVGYAFFQTPNNTAVMARAPADRRGLVSSLLTLSRNLGFITGASVMGVIFALAAGPLAGATPMAVAEGLHVSFEVATGLALTALLLAVTAMK